MIFHTHAARWENPLMGWTSTNDPRMHLTLYFDTKDEALRFAERQGEGARLCVCGSVCAQVCMRGGARWVRDVVLLRSLESKRACLAFGMMGFTLLACPYICVCVLRLSQGGT
jgi:hypothetical protein